MAPNTAVEAVNFWYNADIKFLPRGAGKKFPNLKHLQAVGCGLTVIRKYYFKNMQKLRDLYLENNKIAIIEPGAFKNLISLKYLRLGFNNIKSLDEKLFLTMVRLEFIYLNSNKISELSPSTFQIPGGKLGYVDLYGNVCINRNYYTKKLLEADIAANCTPQTLSNQIKTDEVYKHVITLVNFTSLNSLNIF